MALGRGGAPCPDADFGNNLQGLERLHPRAGKPYPCPRPAQRPARPRTDLALTSVCLLSGDVSGDADSSRKGDFDALVRRGAHGPRGLSIAPAIGAAGAAGISTSPLPHAAFSAPSITLPHARLIRAFA